MDDGCIRNARRFRPVQTAQLDTHLELAASHAPAVHETRGSEHCPDGRRRRFAIAHGTGNPPSAQNKWDFIADE